ncbi:MAG: hypothetical protein EAZ17_07230 [Sphingobacteriales bacterium]|nr:MAG: hypothetical protein EAZ17_07230 [Sphingobacteriales bacterium]
MGRKSLIAVFLMLIFSIPLLPIAQVGNLLSSNQLQEEIVHSPLGKEVVNQDNDLIHQLVQLSDITVQPLGRCFSEHFLSRQADDINTPPPNA